MTDRLGFVPDDWQPPADEPVLEVPPTQHTSDIPLTDSPSPKTKRGRKRKVADVQNEAASAETKKSINKNELEMAVVVGMSFCSRFIDESFSPLNPDGTVQPRIKEACVDMAPLVEKYGGWMLGAMPYIAFMSGCITLVAPAINPVTEIIAGVRKPRFARTHPGDIYTEEYINAVRRKSAAAHAQQEQTAPASAETANSSSAAAEQTVTLSESDFFKGERDVTPNA